MQKFLILYLVVTGIGALIALSMPWLVLIGFMALIVPGLLLMLMPTAFLYGVIFTVVWLATHTVAGDTVSILLGVLAILAVGVGSVRKTRAADRQVYLASILPEVRPAGRIELQGHVRFDLITVRTNKTWNTNNPTAVGQGGFACDGHCLAALFTPGVTAVTINKSMAGADGMLSPEARTYRLEPRPGCEANIEVNLDSLTVPFSTNIKDRDLLVAQWAIKLASEFCLTVEPVRAAADFTIVERRTVGTGPKTWAFGPGRLRQETIEIFAQDRLVHRAHRSTMQTLAVFLSIMPEGGMENFRFDWSRTTFSNRPRREEVTLAKSLVQYTNLTGQLQKGAAGGKGSLPAMLPQIRTQIDSALDDANLTAKSPAFHLLEEYFKAVGANATEDDIARVRRIVADRRLVRFPGIWAVRLPFEKERLVYESYFRRLLETGAPAHTQNSLMQIFVDNLGREAAGLIGPDQEALLGDPLLRLAVPELVKALGYGGKAESVRLLRMLKEHAAAVYEIQQQRTARVISSSGRNEERGAHLKLLHAAKSALCMLGLEGRSIRGDLEVFLQSGMLPPYEVSGHGMTQWNVILARMGKPIEEFRKPERLSGSESNYLRSLREKVERWTPDRG